MMGDRRCPSCGALVSADAEWCGQCYTPLERREPNAVTASGSTPQAGGPTPTSPPVSTGPIAGAIEIGAGKLAWTCPVCETRNPIEANECPTCGTPFSRLLEEPAHTPQVSPQTAAVWSLAFPGLGHWKLGLRTDAVARFAMFGWAFGALLILLVSRFGKGGLGPTFPLFLLFLGASLAIYVLSAVDAYRLASGDPPLLNSRTLLWASAGLVFLSVLIATFVTLPAARR